MAHRTLLTRYTVAGTLMVIGAVANLAYLAEFIVGSRLDNSFAYVSELAARGEPTEFVYRGAELLAGVSLMAAVVTAWPLLPQSRYFRLASVALFVFATATAADAFLPLDCAPSASEECRARELSGDVSTVHTLHTVTGVTEAITASVAILAAGYGAWVGRRHHQWGRRWERIALPFIVLGCVYAGAAIIFAILALIDQGPLGAIQRMQLALFSTSLFLAAGMIFSARPRGNPMPQPASAGTQDT